MNGQAKDLSDRNTCFTFCSDERGLGLEENLRLSSLILAYVRVSSLNGRKMFAGLRLANDDARLPFFAFDPRW